MTKKELSLMYAPELSVDGARHRLHSWFMTNPKLMQELYAANYRDSQRIFTARQVEIIFSYLGEP